MLALTDDEALAEAELDCPKLAVTVVVPAVNVNWLELPKLAETVVPDDTVGIVDGGGDCIGGADVWAGVGEYCNVGVGIVILGSVGLGNILLIGCGCI